MKKIIYKLLFKQKDDALKKALSECMDMVINEHKYDFTAPAYYNKIADFKKLLQ